MRESKRDFFAEEDEIPNKYQSFPMPGETDKEFSDRFFEQQEVRGKAKGRNIAFGISTEDIKDEPGAAIGSIVATSFMVVGQVIIWIAVTIAFPPLGIVALIAFLLLRHFYNKNGKPKVQQRSEPEGFYELNSEEKRIYHRLKNSKDNELLESTKPLEPKCSSESVGRHEHKLGSNAASFFAEAQTDDTQFLKKAESELREKIDVNVEVRSLFEHGDLPQIARVFSGIQTSQIDIIAARSTMATLIRSDRLSRDEIIPKLSTLLSTSMQDTPALQDEIIRLLAKSIQGSKPKKISVGRGLVRSGGAWESINDPDNVRGEIMSAYQDAQEYNGIKDMQDLSDDQGAEYNNIEYDW